MVTCHIDAILHNPDIDDIGGHIGRIKCSDMCQIDIDSGDVKTNCVRSCDWRTFGNICLRKSDKT